jgi:hypothetical protein
MKKVILSLGIIFMSAAAALAQDSHAGHGHDAPVNTAVVAATTASGTAADAKASTMKPEDMQFTSEIHDFGVIPEGPNADYEFVFKNTGKEPIVIQQVHASCGCTTPSYSKDPVLPGKTGIVKASYSTQGRPNAFTKTITVMSNVGVKTLSIKGTVEKAPESSVPASTSMIKTN